MTDGIGRASAFLASGTIVSRILGFVKAIIVAATIGVVGSAGADAFAVANALPNTVYVIVAGGVLSAVLVPQIVRAGAHADGGSGYINKLLTVALVILAGATIIATALAPLLTLRLRRDAAAGDPRPRDRVRVVVPAADLLLRALHAARRGAQRATQLRAVHLGAGAQQHRRDRGPARVRVGLRRRPERRTRSRRVDARR